MLVNTPYVQGQCFIRTRTFDKKLDEDYFICELNKSNFFRDILDGDVLAFRDANTPRLRSRRWLNRARRTEEYRGFTDVGTLAPWKIHRSEGLETTPRSIEARLAISEHRRSSNVVNRNPVNAPRSIISQRL